MAKNHARSGQPVVSPIAAQEAQARLADADQALSALYALLSCAHPNAFIRVHYMRSLIEPIRSELSIAIDELNVIFRTQ